MKVESKGLGIWAALAESASPIEPREKASTVETKERAKLPVYLGISLQRQGFDDQLIQLLSNTFGVLN